MRIAVAIGVAALLLVAVVGLYVTNFTAYMGNNPSTCNNCHVMDNVYESWYHGGHRSWTTCNDCHTPHPLIPKYFVKAQSGYHHVSAFMLGEIPDAIRAKEASRRVVQENCVRCHLAAVENLDWQMGYTPGEEERYCFDCHRAAAHGERGISILPYRHTEENQ